MKINLLYIASFLLIFFTSCSVDEDSSLIPIEEKEKAVKDLFDTFSKSVVNSESYSKYREEIQHLPPITDKASLKSNNKRIHTETVQKAIANYPDNKVLNTRPPEVNDKEEISLPRTSRCLLSQLRSGYSRMLNSYKSRIDQTIIDQCPDCGQSPHNTNHLFSCASNPTNLTPRSLWTTPHQAANFLNLDEGVT